MAFGLHSALFADIFNTFRWLLFLLWSYKYYAPADLFSRGQKRKQRWANKWGDKKGKFGEDKKGGDDDDDDDEDDEEDAAGNKKKAPVPLDEHKPLDDGSGKRFGGDAPPVLVG